MAKFKLTQKHLDFANDLWESNLTDSGLVKKHGISPRTVTRWKKRPEIEDVLRQIAEDTRRATLRTALRYADRAVKSLVKLTETVSVTTDEGSDQNFKYSPETVRKAANDILAMAGVMPEDTTQGSEAKDSKPEEIIITWGGHDKSDKEELHATSVGKNSV